MVCLPCSHTVVWVALWTSWTIVLVFRAGRFDIKARDLLHCPTDHLVPVVPCSSLARFPYPGLLWQPTECLQNRLSRECLCSLVSPQCRASKHAYLRLNTYPTTLVWQSKGQRQAAQLRRQGLFVPGQRVHFYTHSWRGRSGTTMRLGTRTETASS